MLSSSQRLLGLKVLVLLSVVGSLASAYTLRQGWGEVYPFATWKLYTQPRGSNHVYSTFRIYTRHAGDTIFRRQTVEATPTFNQDDYGFMLENLGSSTLADSAHQTNALERLQVFVKHLYPNAREYRVVLEKVQVKDLLHHPEKYEADTVARF